jgi:hypothetical protein
LPETSAFLCISARLLSSRKTSASSSNTTASNSAIFKTLNELLTAAPDSAQMKYSLKMLRLGQNEVVEVNFQGPNLIYGIYVGANITTGYSIERLVC